jgi:hypothetical protein
MVGIDFCLANTFKEAAKADRYVKFEEKLHVYLWNEENFHARLKKKEFIKVDLLIGLDQYGDKLFNVHEINELINICEILLRKYTKNNKDEQGVRKFAEELKELCEGALEKGKLIFAAGD